MERYIPYEKMSKRQKKEWNARKRILWSSNPVTRKIEDKKRYNRIKVQRIDRSDFTEPFYICLVPAKNSLSFQPFKTISPTDLPAVLQNLISKSDTGSAENRAQAS